MKYLLPLLLFSLEMISASEISQYTPARFCYAGKTVIRTFTQADHKMQLSVDTQTLQTTIEPLEKAPKVPCEASPYQRLLERSNQLPYPLQNDGITHGGSSITISTDLCPSSKQGFERKLYEAMIEKLPHPVPVTLFITGRWIEHHTRALAQFRAWEEENLLAITWGNHTYAHPYHPKVPLKKNFALSQGYDLEGDTLALEKMLIEKGITPSIFFRFPGLVSDQKAMQAIQNIGLVVIGSDTWIAKGQKIKTGSIILLHGNKNEPKGVEMFLEMLQKNKIHKVEPLGEGLLQIP